MQSLLRVGPAALDNDSGAQRGERLFYEYTR